MIKFEQTSSETPAEHEMFLKMLTHTGKYLEALNVDPSLLKSYRRLLRYLRSLPAERFQQILGETPDKNANIEKKNEPQLSEQEISAMPPIQIIDLVLNQETPRKLLEKIAVVRFSVTKGALSMLRNRSALVEKIQTLLNNESAHDSITRVAGQQGNKEGSN